MQLTYDYNKDTFSTYGDDYPLLPLREWLAEKYPELVGSHFIKTIKSEGVYKSTFDWYNIYQVAEDSGLIQEYFNSQYGKKY